MFCEYLNQFEIARWSLLKLKRIKRINYKLLQKQNKTLYKQTKKLNEPPKLMRMGQFFALCQGFVPTYCQG